MIWVQSTSDCDARPAAAGCGFGDPSIGVTSPLLCSYMSSLMPYVLVAAGGSIGAVARFVLARWVGVLVDTRFPLGTFVINITGSFLLGIVGTLAAEKVFPNSDAVRLALGVGFLGAYTTFSTFEYETHALLEDGSWVPATMNMVASLFVGLVAVRAGIVAARTWLL